MTAVTARSDMSLVKLIERFGANEDRCRDFLAELRWPEGVRCVRCDSDKVGTIRALVGNRNGHEQKKDRKSRSQFECSRCGHQFSVTAGTVLHDTHLPLWKWFLATYLMTEAKKGVSANQLRRELAVSYKTAWYLCHRIRSAMTAAGGPLEGTVEMDETYIGGRARSGSKRAKGAGSGNPQRHKAMVLGAIERGGRVVLKIESRHATGPVIAEFVTDSVSGKARAVYTDQAKAYEGVDFGTADHQTVDHSSEEWVRGDVTTNGIESAWSLLKRSIVGSYHQLSAKHLPAYLEEFAFRFNNRENPFLFRDTLLALVEADPLRYDTLTNE